MAEEYVSRHEFNGLGSRVNKTETSVSACQAEHKARYDEMARLNDRHDEETHRFRDKLDSTLTVIFDALNEVKKVQSDMKTSLAVMGVKVGAFTAGIVIVAQIAMKYLFEAKVAP